MVFYLTSFYFEVQISTYPSLASYSSPNISLPLRSAPHASLLQRFSLLNNDNLVGIPDCCQPVGDHQGHPPLPWSIAFYTAI